MKHAFTVPLAFVCLVITVAVMFNIDWPRCTADSRPAPRIGGVLVIGGCK